MRVTKTELSYHEESRYPFAMYAEFGDEAEFYVYDKNEEC